MSARLATAIVATGLAMLAGSATAQAAFPGPNGQIVYAVGGFGDGLRTVSPDGTGNRTIVFGNAVDPQWSPDGRRIAHHTSNPTSIYIVEADGSASTAVIGDARSAAWSPDGEKIAFTRSVGSFVRLFVANADGSGDTEILGLAGNIGNPAWSPDGSKIAFSLNNARRTHATRLVHGQPGRLGRAPWLPPVPSTRIFRAGHPTAARSPSPDTARSTTRPSGR